MKIKSSTPWKAVAAVLALATLTAAPASTQILRSGIDILETPNATGTSARVDFPNDFFCPGSVAFSAIINLKGRPLATNPAKIAGTTDTIVERLHDADISSGFADIPVVVRAMSLVGTSTLVVDCPGLGPTTWGVSSGCTCGVQPITYIHVQLNDPGCGCGLFSGDLSLSVCLTFIETSGFGLPAAGPIPQIITLAIVDTPWCFNAAAGTVEIQQPFHVDTTCDGLPNLALPCTTNFHPGAQCGLNCPNTEENCHEAPGEEHLHCIEPPCNKITGTPAEPVPTTPDAANAR